MKLILLALFFSLSALASPNGDPTSPAAQLERAKTLYKQGQESEAMTWAEKAGNQGYADAWYWLGMNTTSERMEEYFLKAAELGHSEALSHAIEHTLFRSTRAVKIDDLKKMQALLKKSKVQIYNREETQFVLDQCVEAGEVKISAADQPTAAQLEALGKVQPCFRFHEGIGVEKNLEKYKHCLIRSLANPDEVREVYRDLSEVFANGWGTKKDRKLAMALACASSDVPAELMSQVNALSGKDKSEEGKEFRFCNHTTSGFSGQFCESAQAEVQRLRSEEDARSYLGGLSPAAARAVEKLKKTAEDFAQAEAEYISDENRGGTIRNAVQVQIYNRILNVEFPKDLKASLAGPLQVASADDFKKADQELNQAYAATLKSGEDAENRDLLKKSQRAWLKFRDAWGDLYQSQFAGKFRSADLDRTGRTAATRRRVRELRDPRKAMAE